MIGENMTFTFKPFEIDLQQGRAQFHYVTQTATERYEFTEKLSFPVVTGDVPEALLQNILMNLSLALGISYWKLYCPKTIVLSNGTLTKEQAQFWNTVYTKGLGEFFYKNALDYRSLVAFPFVDSEQSRPVSLPRTNRSLVGVGGGKDSIVTGELLKAHKKPFTAFSVHDHPIRQHVIQTLGVDSLLIHRAYDPLLFELNKKKGTYNGHVPVSAQHAWIALLCALLYDYAYIIVSNERSANIGNVQYLGEEMNHQWSKSFEFEQLFQQYIKQFVTPSIQYFSLLRPLSELHIAKLFTAYPKYFSLFSSCNRNFHFTKPRLENRWCGECPKCAFVFIMLAAFLPKDAVVNIFGKNLFADATLIPVFKDLLGVGSMKPFECVGTPEEVRLALYYAYQKGEYAHDEDMKMFANDVLPTIGAIELLEKEIFTRSNKHAIPEEFQSVLNTI